MVGMYSLSIFIIFSFALNVFAVRLGPIRYSYDNNPQSNKPHIIIILADDMGWNDVSFHGSNQIPTPNIDALAYNGVILNNHYVSALCTPSRAALMTGKYPIHTGMQHLVLLESEPRGLPLTEKLLPQYLKESGYRTHAVGKWHLGFYKREYTPTYRGFDSHFGYWNGLQDYYSHIVESTIESWKGFDMRRNMSIAWDTVNKYSTDLFTEEAVRLIETHDTRNPMFLYLAHLAPHTGNKNNPMQAPDEEIAKFSYIKDPERRIYAAMVSKLDQGIGDVITALRRRNMLENSIILFMSDNGAPTMGLYGNRGSNYPLRGIKDSPWEGAVRGAAAIWSPLIQKPKRVSNQLISIIDWLPTLYSAAGLDTTALGKIDGIDMWSSLVHDEHSPRTEVLVNIDEIYNYASVIRGNFKYIIGTTNSNNGWYGETGRQSNKTTEEIYIPPYLPNKILMSKVGVAISGLITAQQVTEVRKKRKTSRKSEKLVAQLLHTSEILKLRMEAEVKCNVKEEEKIQCDPVESPCLFDLRKDPCEMINIAKQRRMVVTILETILSNYRVTMIPASNVKSDPMANPKYWNNTWVNWKSGDPLGLCTINTGQGLEIPGYAIAISAIALGLFIVGICTFTAMKKCSKKQRSKPDNISDFKIDEINPIDTTTLNKLCNTNVVTNEDNSLLTKNVRENID